MATTLVADKPASRGNPVRLTIACLAAGIFALSFHMITPSLGIPYPSGDLPGWATWLNLSSSAAAILVFMMLAGPRLGRPGSARQALTTFVFLTLMNGVVRKTMMQGFADGAFAFDLLVGTLSLLRPALFAVLCTIAMRWVRPGWQVLPVGLLLGGLYMLLQVPCEWLLNEMISQFVFLQTDSIYSEPYPTWFIVLSYLFFVELVIATVWAAYLVWDSIPGTMTKRTAVFAIIITLIAGALLKAPLFGLTVTPSFWAGLISYGQFTLQFMALGALVGLAWHHFGLRR